MAILSAVAAKLVGILAFLALAGTWITCIVKPSLCQTGVRVGSLVVAAVATLFLVAVMFKRGPSLVGIGVIVSFIPQLVLWGTCLKTCDSATTKWAGAGLALVGLLIAFFIP